MATTPRWTAADLEVLPDDGKRYEIIDGELYMSKQPHWYHQRVCVRLTTALESWSIQNNAGETNYAPGVIFAEDDDVVPDLVWVSNERLAEALDSAGHLHASPELVVEVLSPGITNERRDRDAKLKLYARRGVLEYWIIDWRQRQIEVYRRKARRLALEYTLTGPERLDSPLLPGFSLPLVTIFAGFAVTSGE